MFADIRNYQYIAAGFIPQKQINIKDKTSGNKIRRVKSDQPKFKIMQIYFLT